MPSPQFPGTFLFPPSTPTGQLIAPISLPGVCVCVCDVYVHMLRLCTCALCVCVLTAGNIVCLVCVLYVALSSK